MRKSSISGVIAVGAGALSLLLASSTFAESRPREETAPHERRAGGELRREREVARSERDSIASSGRSAAAEAGRNGAYRRDGGQITRSERRDEAVRADASRREETNRGTNRAEASRREETNRGTTRGDDAYRRNDSGRGATRDETYRREESGRGATRDGNYRRDDRGSQRRETASREGSYRGDSHAGRQYRERERVNTRGRVSRYTRERGGYRLWFDGLPYAYWIPEARWHSGWQVGIGLSLGGVFRNGMIYADVFDDPYSYGGNRGYGYGYGLDYVSGYVDDVDYRTGRLWLRDDQSGRLVTIDTRAIDPRVSGIDARDLRRGDRITLEGQWLRNGYFAAERVDSVRSGRY